MKLVKNILNFIKDNKVLTLILLTAALLRLIGISPGYHPYHSDEGMSYSSAIDMIRNLNIDPTRYDYPSLIPLLHAILYTFIFIPVFLVKSVLFSQEDLPTKAKNLVELWQQAVIHNQQTHVLYWGRYITALFGVGVVFLTYKVAKEYFSDFRIALSAAFLTAVNFRQVLNSHLGLPDIYNSFFLLLTFLFIGRLYKNSSTLNYLILGVGLGLYFSVKYQPYVLPAFLIVHTLIAWKDSKKKLYEFAKNFLSKNLFLAGVAAAVTVLLINPFHLIHLEQFKAINSYNVFKYGVGTNQLDFYPLWYLYNIGIGQLISIGILLGVFISLRKYKLSTTLLLSFILIFFYLLVYNTRGGYYTRNFVTVTPLLLMFTGVFLVELCNLIFRNKNWSNIAVAITLVIVSFSSIQNSVVSANYFSQKWGYKEAHDWAEVYIPEKSVIVSHPWDNYPRDKDLVIIPFEQNEIFSLSEMREDNAQFGFLNMDWLSLGTYWWMHMDWDDFARFNKDKPNKILANTYSFVASQELASFSVAKFVKPWQAPDMNFIVVKIPETQKFETQEIASFEFNKESEYDLWHTLVVDEADNRFEFDENQGKTSPGSLKLKNGIHRFPLLIKISTGIQVKEGKAILVSGWIKNGVPLTKKERDALLRVDFFKENPTFDLSQKSIQTSLSSRIYGNSGWQKVEVQTFVPKGAKTMTVSAQANNYNEFWFDDIKVSESLEEVADPRDNSPYIKYTIPDDILLPNSQGNL